MKRVMLLSYAVLFAVAGTVKAQKVHEGFSTVALSGEPLPGMGEGEVALWFGDQYQINDAGQVAFTVPIVIPDPSESRGSALFSGSPKELSLVLRTGDSLPGFPAASVSGFDRLGVNESGSVVFGARFADEGDESDRNLFAIWAHETISVVGADDEVAPGAGDGAVFKMRSSATATVRGDAEVFLSDEDEIVLTAEMVRSADGSGLGHGLWLWKDGSLELTGATEDAQHFYVSPRRSTPGKVVFLEESTFPGVSDSAWFLDDDGPVRVAESETVWIEEEAVFSRFDDIRVDDPGGLAFVTVLQDGGATSEGICVGTHEAFELMLRQGQRISTDSNALFGENFGIVELGGDGRLSFRARVIADRNTNFTGIGLANDSGIEVVFYESLQIPGMPEELTFLFQGFSGLSPVLPGFLMNERGNVVFHAGIGGSETSGDQAIWVLENGIPVPLVRKGDRIRVREGDEREVRSLQIYIPGGSLPALSDATSLSDDGRLLFKARFADFTEGLFIADLNPTANLRIERSDSDVILSWDVVGYTLESTVDLDLDWAAATDQSNPQTLVPSSGELFFRLRKD